MTKPVWYAGLLGGLLGAVFSFMLARALPPAPPKPPIPPPSEAREFGDSVIERLRAGKIDDVSGIPRAVPEETDKWRERNKKAVDESREYCKQRFGQPTGELELLRETVFGLSMTRLVYLEKFPRGAVVWAVALYRAADGWCLISVSVEPLEQAFPKMSKND